MGGKREANLLIVDDHQEHRLALAKIFAKEGYPVTLAADGEEAIQLLLRGSFDLVITDLRMPKKDGLQLLKEIRQVSPRILVILITAYGGSESFMEAMRGGAFSYLDKPVKREDILRMVEKALRWRKAMDEAFGPEGCPGQASRHGTAGWP